MADIVYELFNVYANWDNQGRGGVSFSNVKLLLQEAELLDGIPSHLTDAYVREVMLRADQDQDGLLSLQEFVVWFFSECAALPPFKHAGRSEVTVAPLYNRFVYLCQKHRPSTSKSAAYDKVSGMTHNAFLSMCKEQGWCADPAMLLRNGASLACRAASANRTQGKMEGGTRLQFVQFMSALQKLAARKREGYDAIIYKVVGDGSAPPVLYGHASNDAYRQTILKAAISPFIEGAGPAHMWTRYKSTLEDKEEQGMWVGTDPYVYEELKKTGRDTSSARFVNTRNLRAAFHRYNLTYNKGLAPPSSSSCPACQPGLTQPPAPAEPVAPSASTQPVDGKQPKYITDVLAPTLTSPLPQGLAAGGGAASSGIAGDGDPWKDGGYPACCCMYRQMGLMEQQTFWQVVTDNTYLWEKLQPRSRMPTDLVDMDGEVKPLYPNLAPWRVESAFLSACSIAGVYCSDSGCGIHDKPIQGNGPRPTAMRSPVSSIPKSFGTSFSSTATLVGTRRSMTLGNVNRSLDQTGVLAGSVRPSSASVSPSSSGTPWKTGAAAKASSPSSGQQHRPASPTLTFPQFLEALRLIAEDCKGHPHDLRSVEARLCKILVGVVTPGRPLKPHESLAWTRTGSSGKRQVEATYRGHNGGLRPHQ